MHTTETCFARSGKRWRPARNKRPSDGQKRTCETRLLTTWKFILWVCHGTKRGCQGGCYGGCTVINFDAEMTRSCTQPKSSHRYQKKQLLVWFSSVLFLASCYDADWGPLVCFRSTNWPAISILSPVSFHSVMQDTTQASNRGEHCEVGMRNHYDRSVVAHVPPTTVAFSAY